MNTKAKGSRQERRSIRVLEARGYVCTKAGGSLGIWDVIGVSPTNVVLLQVKSNEWPRSAEMEALTLFKAPPHCIKLVHRWRDHQQLPDVKEIS